MTQFIDKIRSWSSNFVQAFEKSLNSFVPENFDYAELYLDPSYEIIKFDSLLELITINVLAVADYSTCKHFSNHDVKKNPKTNQSNMEEYFREVFKKVDAYYVKIDSNKYRYEVRMSELMTLNYDQRFASDPQKEVDFVDYLFSMRKLLRGKKYDAALAFTTLRDKRVDGEAFLGTVGSKTAHGVVLVDNIDLTSSVAAHELGHILGASHDDPSMGQESIMYPWTHKKFDNLKFTRRSIDSMAKVIDIFKFWRMT